MERTTQEPQKANWFRAAEAMQYFGIKRDRLNCIATKANARKKISTKCVIYDVAAIEEYIRSQL